MAIIPARGGSKGIPRKNLALLDGRPLIWWTINAVARARIPIRLAVTTDDDEIASYAKACGCEMVQGIAVG